MKTSFTRILPYAGVAAMMMAAATQAPAAPVLPADARSEAARFLSQGHPGLRTAPANPDLKLAYTADSDGSAAFYIFNHADGFVIVTADDRLPTVLGYSDHGQFDPDRIPDNFKWWLGEYTREIGAWLPTAPETAEGSEAVRMKAVANRPAIEPIITTKWNQDTPYNNECPMDGALRSVTGCVATAMAQIMKHYEWPERPVGSSGGMVFDGTTFSWRNMLDVYESGKYSASQAAAVAKLMRVCGAAVNMQYSYWSSGAYDNAVPYAFTQYFNYDKGVKMVWKDYTAQSKWNDLVYSQLSEGNPIYYSGASSQGGHAFVCDGYSENEYFHFNWGWGGYQDGYFRLTALNPASGGAGSYEGGYNSGQTILVDLRPAAAPGASAPTQAGLLSTGGFFYAKDNTYEILQDPSGFNLIYNPMAYSQTVAIGIKYTDLDHPGNEPKYSNAGSETLRPQYGIKEITASAPSLSDGTYSVTPVYSSDGGNTWEPILIPLGKQNYVRLTVAGRQYNYENVGPDDSNRPNMIAEMPITTPVIYGNADMAFRVPVINIGEGDYMASLGFTLVEQGSEFGDSASLTDSAPISGKSYQEWEVSFDEDIHAGEYLLYVQDEDENFLIDGAKVQVKDGDFPPVTTNGKVTVENLAPNFMVSDQDNPIYFTVNSKSIFEETIEFRFTILDAVTLKKVQDLLDYSVKVPANFSGRVRASPRDLGVKPGYYMWYVADKDGNAISRATPLIVTSGVKTSAEGICYIVTDEAARTATIVPPEGNPYSGECVVPAKVDGYDVTAIRNDAFAFSTAASVTLPASVSRIPAGAFYDDWRLENLTLEATEMVDRGEMAFNMRYVPSCWLIVPDELSNLYAYDPDWLAFKMTKWYTTFNGVEVESGMMMNPATGAPYSPYYVNCFAEPEIRFKDPDGKNVHIEMKVNGQRLTDQVIDPRTMSLRLPALGMHGVAAFIATATTQDVGVDEIGSDGAPVDVYSIDGYLLLRDAAPEDLHRLPAGLYIAGGRKIIIRDN